MDQVKEAFQKVREDISLLNYELNSLREDVYSLRDEMVNLIEIFKEISEKRNTLSTDRQTNPQTDKQTNRQTIILPTYSGNSTQNPPFSTNPTYNSTFSTDIKPLEPQFLGISIGNEGVPTDRQTNPQTNRHIEIPFKSSHNQGENPFHNAANFLDSLDELKKELRLKFKKLTDQELIVFSTLYQLTEGDLKTDYKALSEKLKLTESSIRDYIGRLLKKGIPVEKTRVNNKNIALSISPNLKKVASLNTILQLKDL